MTQSQLVPTMFVRMLKTAGRCAGKIRYVSSLKGAVHAAAPCPADVKAKIDWLRELIPTGDMLQAPKVMVTVSTRRTGSRIAAPSAAPLALKILDDDGNELPARGPARCILQAARSSPIATTSDKTQRAFNEQAGLDT